MDNPDCSITNFSLRQSGSNFRSGTLRIGIIRQKVFKGSAAPYIKKDADDCYLFAFQALENRQSISTYRPRRYDVGVYISHAGRDAGAVTTGICARPLPKFTRFYSDDQATRYRGSRANIDKKNEILRFVG